MIQNSRSKILFQAFMLSVTVLAPSAHADAGFFESTWGSIQEGFENARNHVANSSLFDTSRLSLPSFLSSPTEVSSRTTQDGSLILRGEVPLGTRWLMIRVTKSDGPYAPIQTTARMESRQFETPIYLSQKAGKYRIDLYASNTEARIGNHYIPFDYHNVRNEDTRDMRYLMASPETQASSPEIMELAQSLTQGLQSDREKSTAIHDWIARNISYDYESAKKGSNFYDNLNHDALTVLHQKAAICSGYANLNTALHRAAGIRARGVQGVALVSVLLTSSISSTPPVPQSVAPATDTPTQGTPPDPCQSINHAWNEIFIDGKWEIQDTTWDAGFIDPSGNFTPNYRSVYLFPTADDFKNDHLRCLTVPN